ncbi:MAG: ATP-binding cassette domain-containing protein [Chloroflexi bacterium]|nr:ATP-binding cassette domain-containing protein [Chloroflexota bacterium]
MIDSDNAGARNVFELRDVEYSYEKTLALTNVALDIRQGEKVAILGANGTGKSTLLKLLDALCFPTKGTITAFGQPLTEHLLREQAYAHAFRRRVGLVFQDPDVQLFSPTVWDELAFGPLQLGLPRAEILERIHGVMALMGIEKLKDRPPYRLSGGEKKKVALASVLVVEPDVLLLDEPTASLDPRSQTAFIDMLLEMNERGTTLVAATHDLDILEDIADRACVIGDDHSIAAIASPGNILSDRQFLLATNLIHEHPHRHVDRRHVHPHWHRPHHDHEH